jgi:gamma-glutamyltranspeptidase/glutathione hydrolase
MTQMMTRKKTKGVIAAGHPLTAQAGIEMLNLGGNAFDAAVAAILASFVTEPALTSAAGGGFLLAHTQDQQNILFDFFTQTPCYKKPEKEINFYPVYVNFGATVQEFHIGLGSMAVPGNIAGVFHVHKKLGKLPFSVVAEPAITYARQGVQLTEFQSYLLTLLLEPIVTEFRDNQQIYKPTGEPITAGGTVVMTDFANTLTHLAKTGVNEFYQGEIAHQLVKDCQEKGGYLTLEDLTNYQIIERNPLLINYRGNILLTNPPPSAGGTLIAFALKLLATVDLTQIQFGSEHHLQLLNQVMKLTNEARKDSFDGFLFQENIAEIFLNSSYFDFSKNQLSQLTQKWGSTTQISVVDELGNAASVTTSNGEGSGYVIPHTGIMVNNMLGEDDLNPYGFHQWQENVRISSMMAPTIVLKNNQPEIVLGSGGSKRIRTAILQVISNIIDFQMPVEAAVSSPRVHWDQGMLQIEPGFDPLEIQKLELLIEDQINGWQEQNMFFGGVHTVLETPDGSIAGAGDPRRGGVVMSN